MRRFAAQSQAMVEARQVDVEDALQRVSDIHAQIARATYFRGYRAVPVASMGAVAFVGATVESLGAIGATAAAHAWYWLGIAVLCGGIGALDMFRTRRSLPTRTVSIAVVQLLPSLFVGLALGVLLADRAEMLPGVWTMVFGLGVLASRPYLPGAILGVALFYVCAGIGMAFAARTGTVPSPWEMGLTFGVGQFVAAAALRRPFHDDEVTP